MADWIMSPWNEALLPSVSSNFLSAKDEKLWRWKTCLFIEEAGARMSL